MLVLAESFEVVAEEVVQLVFELFERRGIHSRGPFSGGGRRRSQSRAGEGVLRVLYQGGQAALGSYGGPSCC